MDGMDGATWAKAAAYFGAAFAIAIGCLGPALAQGFVGRQACESVGKNPEMSSQIQRIMIIALGIVESSAVYAFIVAMVLLFRS